MRVQPSLTSCCLAVNGACGKHGNLREQIQEILTPTSFPTLDISSRQSRDPGRDVDDSDSISQGKHVRGVFPLNLASCFRVFIPIAKRETEACVPQFCQIFIFPGKGNLFCPMFVLSYPKF